jgi:transposase InsO family protein
LSTADLLPLERVQIDHTLVDVVIVDEGDRLPIGRPWLTLVIDVASRAVLGFSVSLDEPSTASVALALVQAVLPKDLWLADRELEVPWPMWGLPELLQLDNAPEFHSRALIRGAQEYGVRIDYRPPASKRANYLPGVTTPVFTSFWRVLVRRCHFDKLLLYEKRECASAFFT